MEPKRLSIILPSYNDGRIGEAIESVRRFDDVGTVRLVVIDGGSEAGVREAIERRLAPDDIFVSEPDGGIFDALNKGLDRCTTKYIGWLGSDDLFTGQLLASEVLGALQDHDLLVANLALFRDGRVRRVTHAWPSRFRLARYGLHNPHFSTFGRAALLKSERFDLRLRGADIAYFLHIFAKKPGVLSTNVIATLQGEGGFSTRSYRKSLNVNMELISVYAKYTNVAVAPIALCIKMGYKLWSSIYYRIFRLDRGALEVRRAK
jgi:glycosyltransferase